MRFAIISTIMIIIPHHDPEDPEDDRHDPDPDNQRVPNRPPLPDIVLDNTTYHAWGLAASEVLGLI